MLALEPFPTLACQSPKVGLDLVDKAFAVAPNLVSQFNRAINWLFWNSQEEQSSEHPKEIAEQAIYALLNSPIKRKPYAKARHKILVYCCKEGLPPERMIQWLQEMSQTSSAICAAALMQILPCTARSPPIDGMHRQESYDPASLGCGRPLIPRRG